jgi:lipoprotein-anchoring transpeptidase ErfK/SrfK
MQRIMMAALLASASGIVPVHADPYSYNRVVTGSVRPQPVQYQVQQYVVPAPQPVYAAQSGSNMGGGFIEFLFGGEEATSLPEPQQMRPMPMPAPQLQPQSRTAMVPQPLPRYGREDYAPAEPPAVQNAVIAPMDPKFLPQTVAYTGAEKPGTIVINTREKLLYLVEDGGKAMRYGVGVGKEGFLWAGTNKISNKREWPDWTPPAEMLQRRPELPRFMKGGPNNPLGARAMYLGSTLYRIHGSNEPWTIGHNVSSGCIRMRNEDVIDLYERVHVGAKVVVI